MSSFLRTAKLLRQRIHSTPSAMSVSYGHGAFGEAHLAGWIPSITDDESLFDPLTTSGSRLQELLASGELTSMQIVNQYYRQILTYNGYLKAVYQLAPGALDRAKALDKMRADGEILGPLHGIPVLLKDNIGTKPAMQMDSTGCNLALVGSTAIKNAPIVDSLVAAGAIILGKTTLSELMWFKGTGGIPCGWSALHGQSQNPYIGGGVVNSDGTVGHSSPGGSSSGSSIAVAAGFAPMAIGTETEGSLVSPATRQSLYTIKASLGVIPNEGIIPINRHLDVPGPLCTTVKDTVDLFTVLVGNGKSGVPSGTYTDAMKGEAGWGELRIGTLDPDKFRYDESIQTRIPEAVEQIKDVTLRGYKRLEALAAEYHHYVDLRPASDFEYEGSNAIFDLLVAEFESDFDAYMRGTQGAAVSSLKELAQWNKDHADKALPPEYPNQMYIERSIAPNKDPSRLERLRAHIAEVGRSLLDTFDNHGINVIIGPADSEISKFSAATGCPLCSLPLGYIGFNGRPIGLMAMARSEVTLITLMSAFETSFRPRKPPSAFLSKAVRPGSS
ncbi:amidase family protein [Nemania sp. FL0031]|nr:amidase family protein [Nemania sp. FL0031]